MSSVTNSDRGNGARGSGATRRSPTLWRWAVAGGVLLAEYLSISLTFDAHFVIKRGGSWEWIGQIGALAPLGVVAVAALLLLRRAWRSRHGGGEAASSLPRPSVLLLGSHVVLYVGSFLLTRQVFGLADAPPGPAWLWFAAWMVLAAATALALLLGLLGGAHLRQRAWSWAALGVGAFGVGVVAWLAGNWTLELWRPLSRATLTVVVAMLRAVSANVVVDADRMTLGLDGFGVKIAPICSGAEGIGLIAVLLIAFLVAFRKRLRFPHALLLLPLGVVLVWLLNAFRIAALMGLGAYVDADMAIGAFHSKAGWVFFCAVGLGVAALGQRLAFFSRDLSDEPTENPTAAYLMPLLALIGTALVTGMFSQTVDRFYGLRLVLPVIMLYAYRSYYRDFPKGVSLWFAPLGVAVAVGWLLTAPAAPPAPADQPSAAWLILRILGAVVVVPIVEELAFRGFLLRWLVNRKDFTAASFRSWTVLAVLGSSLLFGLVHARWIEAALAGVVYAVAMLLRGRLLDAILAHALTNAIIAGWVMASGDWTYWP